MKRILEIKKKIGTLSKTSTNPFFKSKYLDLNDLLEHIEPLLWEEGLLLVQPIHDNKVVSMIIDCETNEPLMDSGMIIPSNITDPQKLGSAITYFRRYTLKSLLAISEEDDDGNSSSNKVVKPTRKDLGLKPILTSEYAINNASEGLPLDDLKEVFEVTKEQEDKYLKLLEDGNN